MRGILSWDLGVRGFWSEAFPSWRSAGAAGRAGQSGAAAKAEGSLWEASFGACAARSGADVGIADGKAAVWVGMLIEGGADVG